MRSNGIGAIGAIMGAVALALPSLAGAQATLPASTKVNPGSPASGFAPTAYAKSASEFQNDVRELDATQVQLSEFAQQKASPRVQDFAKQVRTAFSGGRSSLKGMSNDQGVPLVGTRKLAREHQTLLAQLRAPHANVDRLFVDYEVLLLKEHLGLVQPYATGGVEARLRQASAEAVSSDQVLLGAARALQQ